MPRPSANPDLTLDGVIDTAIALIDELGYDALTMRELATRCGVGVMTLYGYMRTKEELLAAVADRLFGELDLSVTEKNPTWQDEVKAVFRAAREMFTAHPELAAVGARQHANSNGYYRGAEAVLAAMRRGGVSGPDAVSGFLALATFTTGFAQRQAYSDVRAAQSAQRLEAIGHLPGPEFPTVVELAGLLLARESDEQFESGLDFIVRGIAERAAS